LKNGDFNIQKGYYEKKGYPLFLKNKKYHEMYKGLTNNYHISFILGLINEYTFSNSRKIENVLEIGVFNGVASAHILEEGLKRKNFKLYGIEKSVGGFYGEAALKEFDNEELKHYHLNTGCTSSDIQNILDKNDKLDLVFIDGAHTHPLVLMDLIYVIPYLHEESIVLLHDVVDYMRPNAWGESFIYLLWEDYKYRSYYLDKNLDTVSETVLGLIKIPQDKSFLQKNIKKIATIPFRASPFIATSKDPYENYLGVKKEDIEKLNLFMSDTYDEKFANEICSILYKNLEEYEKNMMLHHHETKFFNYHYNKFTDLKNDFDKQRVEIGKDKEMLNQILIDITEIKNDFDKQRVEIGKDKEKLNQIKKSNSWKLTAPLRKIRRKLKIRGLKKEV
jgi:hypothetical protein